MRFLICLLLALSLCGCAQAPDPPDLTQRYPSTYLLTGEMGGVSCALSVEMHASGRGDISFQAPDALAGVSFRVHNLPDTDPEADALQYAERGITVLVGSLEIPLSEGAYPATIYGLIKAFSTTNDQLTEVTRQGAHTLLTYTHPNGYLTFTVASDGTPTHLYIDLYGAVSDLSIQTVTYKENPT